MSALNLVDIKEVKIDRELPIPERIKSIVEKLKNPYRFKHNNIVVNVNYVGEDSLEDRIICIYKNI